MSAPPSGLCENCSYAKRVQSSRRSLFLLCRRSEHDPSYARYPSLPVVSCAGYAAAGRGAEPDAPRRAR